MCTGCASAVRLGLRARRECGGGQAAPEHWQRGEHWQREQLDPERALPTRDRHSPGLAALHDFAGESRYTITVHCTLYSTVYDLRVDN